MLDAKACHAGLRPRSRFLGLEPLDLLLLFPGLYVGSVVLKNPLLAVGVSLVMGVALRLLRWGRLPGYTQALAHYLLREMHAGVFGADRHAPAYPLRCAGAAYIGGGYAPDPACEHVRKRQAGGRSG